MIARIEKSVAKGVVEAPPSKSYSHRLLIASFLAGKGNIHNIAFSNDVSATIECLESLGATFSVTGFDVRLTRGEERRDIFPCRESGSTLRFLIPIALVLLKKGTFTGTNKLFSRGLSVYEEIFKEQNIAYELGENSLKVEGELKPGKYKILGNISSQFITGLLFALPLLDGDSEIEIIGELESKPYINITIDVLDKFGVQVIESKNRYIIKGNQIYQPQECTVEGDYSNSAFLEMLNYFPDNDVKITGLNPQSSQGDMVYQKILPLMATRKAHVDISNCIDLGPALFTFAAIHHGAIIRGIHRLRIKESDRVNDMLEILSLFGCEYYVEEDEVEINPIRLSPVNKVIYPKNDHRLVMATSILLTFVGGSIANIEAVDKSYPDFFKALEKLGVRITYVTE